MTPTFIVTPFKDEPETTLKFLQMLKYEEFEHCLLYDNGSTEKNRQYILNNIEDERILYNYAPNMTIYEMWNDGWRIAGSYDYYVNVAFFNNDIEWDIPIINNLASLLRSDSNIGCVYPDYRNESLEEYLSLTPTSGTFKDNGMAGFAFMIKAELAPLRVPFFDTSFKWWCGDDFIEMKIRKAGLKVCRVNGLKIQHDQSKTASNGKNNWVDEAKNKDLTRFQQQYAAEFNSLRYC